MRDSPQKNVSTTMTHSYTLPEWPESRTLATPGLERAWSCGDPRLFLMGMQNAAALVKDGSVGSYKTNKLFSYDPAVTLLTIYPEDLKIQVYTKPTRGYLCLLYA